MLRADQLCHNGNLEQIEMQLIRPKKAGNQTFHTENSVKRYIPAIYQGTGKRLSKSKDLMIFSIPFLSTYMGRQLGIDARSSLKIAKQANIHTFMPIFLFGGGGSGKKIPHFGGAEWHMA